jgi:hypothetical protein
MYNPTFCPRAITLRFSCVKSGRLGSGRRGRLALVLPS